MDSSPSLQLGILVSTTLKQNTIANDAQNKASSSSTSSNTAGSRLTPVKGNGQQSDTTPVSKSLNAKAPEFVPGVHSQ